MCFLGGVFNRTSHQRAHSQQSLLWLVTLDVTEDCVPECVDNVFCFYITIFL